MISEKESKKISKFLSFVLRHHPEIIGIKLDENGWTEVDSLLTNANEYGLHLDKEILKHIVDNNTKKRFSFNQNFDKIRANQGHSVKIELGYAAQKSPDILYHGTGQKHVDSILQTGLEKKERHQVHLSIDIETAIAVGQRHGKPFVFEILAGQMYIDKFQFFLSDNAVWLTDTVPTKYLLKHQSTK